MQSKVSEYVGQSLMSAYKTSEEHVNNFVRNKHKSHMKLHHEALQPTNLRVRDNFGMRTS